MVIQVIGENSAAIIFRRNLKQENYQINLYKVFFK